ncbi:cytochrome P450 [Auriscalpium vulgare]|uniref:Cytochrome P450 n=1 Tax=Auriscalpium vulgare TaxID=40419 RepID=A0ACB8RB40_9AGAM|nr:cytochrome P450 [Auriscalpium vulgare]
MEFGEALRTATRPLNVLIEIIVFFILYVLFNWLVYPRYFSPLRNLPGPPLENTILGHFGAIIKSGGSTLQMGWVKEYGGVVRSVGPLGKERLLMLRPEALHKILVSDWMDYPKPNFLRKILGLVAGYGLLAVTGNEHRQMRKAMNPAFSLPNLMAQTDMYFDAINTLVGVLKAQIARAPEPSKGKVFPMYEWMSKITLDVICATGFGYYPNSLLNPDDELTDAYDDLIGLQSGLNLAKFSGVVALPGMARFLTSETGYKFRNLWKVVPGLASVSTFIDSLYRLRRVSRKMLAEKLADSAVNVDDFSAKKDIMSLLVRARNGETKDGYKLSDEALVDQVLTFLGAGHETTASGLSWSLWLLATHPEVQQRLRDEVAPIFAETDRPEYRVLKDLTMLDCVVMESLRVLPPVPMTVREATKSDWIAGVYVPKGTLFQIPLRVVNTWEETWGPDADQFRPERWLDLPSTYNPTFSMMSFIAGPKACIGRTMGISEMKAVLAAMVANFEFAPSYEGQIAHPTAAITMKPADNMPLLVTLVRK